MKTSKAAIVALALVLLALNPATFAQSAGDAWVGTWTTSLVGRPQTPAPAGGPGLPPFMPSSCPAAPAPNPAPPAPTPGRAFAPTPFVQYTNQTLRQIVHTSIGGSKARVVLSNAYGTAPITIGAGHIALRDKEGAIRTPGAPLTFSGRPTTVIAPGAVLYSDAVNLALPALADLAIDLYLPGTTDTASPVTMHTMALQTNYVSETGNHVGKATMPTVATTQSWYLLSRVEVVAPDAGGVIVAFGDSGTDGSRSTPDTNNRWPDHLARRFMSAGSPVKMGVLNAAISGNRVLSDAAYAAGVNAMARFDLDALSQAGVTHIIVLEGINDIQSVRNNPTPTAEDIIAGDKQLIERAHSRGIKIYGATMYPYWGSTNYSDLGDAKRKIVNEWIRTSKAFDGVIDTEKIVRDPSDPKKFLAALDSCDHIHPSDAGYKAIADAIDLTMFTPRQAARATGSASR